MYDELYKAWKSEITSEDAQPLPEDFYRRAEAYVSSTNQEETPTDQHTAKGRLLQKEREIVTRLFRELKEARLRKLVILTQSGKTIDPANLTEEERQLAKAFANSLQTFNHETPERKPSVPEEPIELAVLRFLQDIPEIVGTDLRIYGPYKKEDVGSLPSQNAMALVKQGVAKTVEVRRVDGIRKGALDAINNK